MSKNLDRFSPQLDRVPDPEQQRRVMHDTLIARKRNMVPFEKQCRATG